MRALSTLRRATKKCTAKFDRRDRGYVDRRNRLCMLRTLRDLQTEDFSEGPSDCGRAVLRISKSLLLFAGECSQPQITTNSIQRVPAGLQALVLFHEISGRRRRLALRHGSTVTTVPLEGVAQGKQTSTVEDVRRLAGRPRAFGDAIAVFAHERAQPPCPHPSRPWRSTRPRRPLACAALE